MQYIPSKRRELCVQGQHYVSGGLYFNSNALRTFNVSSETRLGKVACLNVLHSDNYVPYFFFRF